MSIRDSIDLFNSKIDKTYWTRQDVLPSGRIAKTVANPVMLPVENYYKVLQKIHICIEYISITKHDYYSLFFTSDPIQTTPIPYHFIFVDFVK